MTTHFFNPTTITIKQFEDALENDYTTLYLCAGLFDENDIVKLILNHYWVANNHKALASFVKKAIKGSDLDLITIFKQVDVDVDGEYPTDLYNLMQLL